MVLVYLFPSIPVYTLYSVASIISLFAIRFPSVLPFFFYLAAINLLRFSEETKHERSFRHGETVLLR